MATSLYQQPINNNLQYTLNTQLAAGGTTATLNASVAGIVNAPGVFVVDRVDSAGNKTPSVREYISFTGVSGSSLTGLTKGLAGSTDQVHNVGAIVEFVPDVTWANAIYSVVTLEHGITGQHLSLASVSGLNTMNLIVPSGASIQALTATQGTFTNLLNASGASIQAFPFRPAWFLPNTLSGASVQLAPPVAMPHPAMLQYAYVTARFPASQASLSFDIQKNFSSIINSSNILTIPINGTFASTASVYGIKFNAGDVLTTGPANVSSFAGDATVVLVCR